MKYIQDFKEGDSISDIYLCKKKSTLTAKNGRAYDSVILQDKTGTVDEQYEYRKDFVLELLRKAGIPLKFDAVIGRG